MLNWIIKKVIVSKVNALLTGREKSLSEVRGTVERWTGRIRKVLSLLSSLSGKLADGRLEAEEVKAIADELRQTIRDW